MINITSAVPRYNTLEIIFTDSAANANVLAFTLDQDPTQSTADPILNADELYTIHPVDLNVTTPNDGELLLLP